MKTDAADKPREWRDLTTRDFASLDFDRTVAILPVAAIEQHGPHLPLSTDAVICEGLLAALGSTTFSTAKVLLLPAQSVGHSLEHSNFAGTLSLNAETLLASLLEIGRSVARAGVRKLMILNTHGGNVAVMQIAALRLRAESQLLVARANSFALGEPSGLFDNDELKLGIHGSEVETSLMLHLRPELVRLEHARDFQGLAHAAAGANRTVGPARPVGLGWMSEDLHREGVSGNARGGDAARGARLLEHMTTQLAQALDELAVMSLPAIRP